MKINLSYNIQYKN